MKWPMALDVPPPVSVVQSAHGCEKVPGCLLVAPVVLLDRDREADETLGLGKFLVCFVIVISTVIQNDETRLGTN